MSNKKYRFPALSWLIILITAMLLSACNSTATNTTAPATVGQPSPTQAAASTNTAVALATPTTAQTTPTARATVGQTAPTNTTAPAPAPTNTTAPTVAAALPPVGNSYPAGPAPTALPPSKGAKQVQLQVPDSLRQGTFGQNRTLTVPNGFTVSVYAKLQDKVRMLDYSPDNVLFASEQSGGRIVRVLDRNGIGERSVFAQGLNTPHGLAFHQIGNTVYLYVAEMDKVSRYVYTPGLERAGDKQVIVQNLPSGGNHVTRTIAFGKDGKLYVSIGSSCNVCEESDKRRAAIVQYNADGTGEKLYAEGLRNGVGITIHPETGELWETENSRDNLGDNLPAEEINIITKEGQHFGWPYCTGNRVFDTNYGRRDQAFCNTTIPPALPMQAHSAPMGIEFYNGTQFPAEYKGNAFVAFRGSWNRSEKTGYKLVRIYVENGRPTKYEDFLTGFLVGESAWGRPIDPIVAPDGSLLLSDDTTNAIYKITYTGN
jgi:glucose/arabinose dehydrogenase